MSEIFKMNFKYKILPVIFLYFLLISAEDDFEDSTNLCQSRCDCNYSNNNQTFYINCTSRNIQKTLSNWPNHTTSLEVSFSFNDIKRLEKQPTSPYQIKLVFDHCNIQELGPGIFENISNVTFVDFSYNQLTSDQLKSDVFKGPYSNDAFEPLKLETLILAYNQIHSLNKKVFEHLPNLKTLNLEGNNMRVLDIHSTLAFSSIPNLENLNLAGNRLVELTAVAIQSFPKLIQLDISNNAFDYVPSCITNVSKTLQVLKISGNPIEELEPEIFIPLEKLRILSANNLSFVHKIETNTFAHLTSLRRIELSNNKRLAKLDNYVFGNLTNVRELYLAGNNLTSLPVQLIDWTGLKAFNISDNPFICNCDLFEISKNLSDTIKMGGERPMCWDVRKPVAAEMYLLGSDICAHNWLTDVKTTKDYISSFRILRMSLITTSIVLLLIFVATSWILYKKWATYRRIKSYPFASQIIYNPIQTDIRI